MYMWTTLHQWLIKMTFSTWWFCYGNSNFKLQMPLENSMWHVRVELCNSSFQLVDLEMSKRTLLLNHDSATVLLGVSFWIYMHIFLFLFELCNYVTSFVVGAIVVPFKYIGNKTSMICNSDFFFCHIYWILTFQKPSLWR